jgi:SAM-dependent methyltransferase
MGKRGWRMTGFDLSEGMVAMARKRAPRAEVRGQAMQSFRVPRGGFELAFNLLSTFKHVLSERDARAHLRLMADALRPGGLYLLGVHLSEYEDRQRRRERWEASRGRVHVVCNLQRWPADPARRRERVRSRLKVTEHGVTSGYETHFAFRTYDVDQLGALLRSEKRFAHVASYGFDHDIERPIDLWGNRLDFVLVLRRR